MWRPYKEFPGFPRLPVSFFLFFKWCCHICFVLCTRIPEKKLCPQIFTKASVIEESLQVPEHNYNFSIFSPHKESFFAHIGVRCNILTNRYKSLEMYLLNKGKGTEYQEMTPEALVKILPFCRNYLQVLLSICKTKQPPTKVPWFIMFFLLLP